MCRSGKDSLGKKKAVNVKPTSQDSYLSLCSQIFTNLQPTAAAAATSCWSEIKSQTAELERHVTTSCVQFIDSSVDFTEYYIYSFGRTFNSKSEGG